MHKPLKGIPAPLIGSVVVIVALGIAALFFAVPAEPPVGPGESASAPPRDPRYEHGLQPAEVLPAARAFYESRPVYERPHDYTTVPEGLPDLRAETCGACHQEIYREWKLSTHRRAWLDDAQFQDELKKSRGEYAESEEEKQDVSWMCVNCHTPQINQLPQVVVGLVDDDIGKPIYADNPHFDPELQLDAITCSTCHVRDGVVYGPFGDTDAPHPVAKGEYLLTEENCLRCHQAEAMYPEQSMGCFFSTGEEWKASDFATSGQTCQSCHMPEVTRKLAEAFDRPERPTRRHWFGGSLIPKHPDWEEEIAPLREVFGSGAEIELVRGEESSDLVVRVTNANAGHLFPTGDPERHVDVRAVVRDAAGEALSEAEVRLGSVYKWWPQIELESDNRLRPGEHHDLALELPEGHGALQVEIVADKYRMHKEAFDYHELEGRYVRGRRFHRSVWQVAPDGTLTRLELEDDRSGE